ncbi:MAG: leucine-rich repeat protein [Clostridia bacterium]|nr:leucine-rich repeat protein [Clostridia bacterium]
MKHTFSRALALLLTAALCLPLFCAFSVFAATVSFDGKTYQGDKIALPFFYTVNGTSATITDCLESVTGEITVPEKLGDATVREVGKRAFSDCDALSALTLPSTVTVIDATAFENTLTLQGAKGSYTETFAGDMGMRFHVPVLEGDSDENGLFDVVDISTTAMYLTGWDIPFAGKQADLDRDFEITIIDLSAAAQMLANWSFPTLYVLGDETAKTETDGYYPAAGYGDYLKNNLLGYTVKNLAADGASAKNTVQSAAYSTVFGSLKENDVVLLSFGIHDADSVADTYAPASGNKDSKGSFAYYLYHYYIEPIRARGAVPVLTTPVVTRPTDGLTFTESTLHSSYADSVRALASDCGATLVDLGAKTQTLYETLGAKQNAYLNTWQTKNSVSLDSSRLSVLGAEKTAAALADELCRLLPKNFTPSSAGSPTVDAYLNTFEKTANTTVFFYSDGTTSETTDTTVSSSSYSVPKGASLIAVDFAEGVLAIDDYAFFAQYDLADLGNPLPSTLVSIGNFAFHSCNSLWLDMLPEKLETIGNSAFYGCENIVVTHLPKSITTIGDYAFYGCDSIGGMNFDASVYSVPANAFRNCTALASVQLHDFVESIEARAFEGCSLIEELALPDGLRTIESRALKDTAITSLSIPASMRNLDVDALRGCTVLSTLSYPLLATDWVAVAKGADWYKETLLSIVNCDDGDVTVEGVVLVDYHAYYSDFLKALKDANEFTTDSKDLNRHSKDEAEAAILIDDGKLTLKLLKDISLSAVTALNGTFSLDLQGKTLTFAAAGTHFELAKDASITVRDSIGGGKVVKAQSASSAQYLYNLPSTGSKLKLEGGTHTCENTLGSAIAVRGMGTKDSRFEMTGGVLTATSGSNSGNAKAVQAPETTVITGGSLSTKTVAGNSYTVSGEGTFTIYGGNFDSYTYSGNSIALFVGGTGTSFVEIFNGDFVTHATKKTGKHISFSTNSTANAVVHGGSFTVDSRKSGDAGACGIATAGPSLVIYDCFAQGNSAGLQALGTNTTVYGGTFVGSDHGGAYFGHNEKIGTVCVFGGTFRFVQPEWQYTTSGTGSAYFNGGGKMYIDSATFEGRQVSFSSLGGDSVATTLYISRSTAPSWRIDSIHTAYFGKGMEGALTTEEGTSDFSTYKDTVFDKAFVDSILGE